MDEFTKKLVAIEQKIDAVYASVEKTRKYFLATIILSVALVILPLIGILVLIPKYLSMLSGLGL